MSKVPKSLMTMLLGNFLRNLTVLPCLSSVLKMVMFGVQSDRCVFRHLPLLGILKQNNVNIELFR